MKQYLSTLPQMKTAASKLRLVALCLLFWSFIITAREKNFFSLIDSPSLDDSVDAARARMDSDGLCYIQGLTRPHFKGQDEFDDSTIGKADPQKLGRCAYVYPSKFPPKSGWLKDIDWYFFRNTMEHSRREQCFLDCITVISEDSESDGIDDAMLMEAARMGLAQVSRVLLEKYHLDPLYIPPEAHEHRIVNAIQEAIRGGYPDIVKILTSGNMNMAIDSYGRTVQDYVSVLGSPIRPHDAKSILGVKVNGQRQRKQRNVRKERRLEVSGTTSTSTKTASSNKKWNTTTALDYVDDCDFDVIEGGEMDEETFFRDYFSTGRPFVLRNHVPSAELKKFTKTRWNKTSGFKLNTKHQVGPTAYPNLTGQKHCKKRFSLLEIENGTSCEEMPNRRMVYAFHPDEADFEELFPQYDGNVLDEKGGWRKIHEWFGDTESDASQVDLAWQVFYGGDGSGATLHWHKAAFNILYVGVKEWRVTPPYYRGFTGMTSLSALEQLEGNAENARHTLRCTQHAGDQIFIPDFWGHMTINHGFTIGAAAILYDDARKKVRATKKKKKDETKKAEKKKTKKKKKKEVEMVKTVKKKVVDEEEKEDEKQRPVPKFLFVHINKTGGTSLISMMHKSCGDEYVSEWWGGHKGRPWHRSFHATADSYIREYGRDVFDKAYTFAVVRHPLARQVSNFFFLVDMCEEKGSCSMKDRLIPKSVDGVPVSQLSDAKKMGVFHDWINSLYEKFPPGSPQHYRFGSKGHGNEEWSTFGASQTSWLVDESGTVVVKQIFKLEELSDNMKDLVEEIPCLKKGKGSSEDVHMVKANKTPKYPDYMLFAENERTRNIINEVYADDFKNFGYEPLVTSSSSSPEGK